MDLWLATGLILLTQAAGTVWITREIRRSRSSGAPQTTSQKQAPARAYGKNAKRPPVVNDDSSLWRKEQEAQR